MNLFLLIILIFAIFTVGAITHEQDIYRACAKYGKSRSAMWTRSINCEAK